MSSFDETMLKRLKSLEREVERLKVKESPGAWANWTPTWTAKTTNPTIGNGTLAGNYFLVGKMCTMYLYLLFGSTTDSGTGNWEFTLPFTSGAIQGYIAGNGYIADYGTPRKYYQAIPLMQSSQTKITQYLWAIPETDQYVLNATTPVTWSGTNTTRMAITLTYPIA